jgi:DNA mismatch repair protein MutS
MAESTPMMAQYSRIKREHMDAILFFRLGDFYEMFQQDAKEASGILGLTLTKRHSVPMCGIPYHAAHTYIARLLRAGKKIAICEQVRLPESGKGIADREVVEVITPGTVVDEDFLEQTDNNYLVALARIKETGSLSYIDLSTGEFYCSAFPWENRIEYLKKELLRLSTREILLQESILEDDPSVKRLFDSRENLILNRFPDWSFSLTESRKTLHRLLGVSNLKGFGIGDDNPAILSTGILIEYIEESSKSLLPHIRSVRLYSDSSFLSLDESTLRNLEILHNMNEGGKAYTLLSVLDFTRTAMGARTLRKWLLYPLIDRKAIEHRQDKLEYLYHNQILLHTLRENLSRIRDLERLTSRVALDKAHAKDLLAIRESLENAFLIEEILEDWANESSFLDNEERSALQTKMQVLQTAIKDDPSILLTEGNLIKSGYNAELDDLHTLRDDSKTVLDKYLGNEKSTTGITSLRIKYNKIIGYFLEVSKTNAHLVPAHFIKRQSLVNSERYTTDKLIELEAELNSATGKIIELERNLFIDIRDSLKTAISELLKLCGHLSAVDCLQSFAQAATLHGYTKPKFTDGGTISIEEGRHPVVEAYLPAGDFIPNDLSMDMAKKTFALITGPNMAGKSTYLRQVALIVLMAQCGAFVPAKNADLRIIDKIFCRVGASDNLARGESTFLVEMNETANILRSATTKSLIIMDEVGRGTATNDGLAIAQAVSEYILEKVQALTLFATHYHELTLLEHKNLINLSMEVIEDGREIIFLKKVKNGPANNSYGIHVAKLAGIPDEVLQRAAEIMAALEHSSPPAANLPARQPSFSGNQPSLFTPMEIIKSDLSSLDISGTTPLEAINLIARWQEFLDQEN